MIFTLNYNYIIDNNLTEKSFKGFVDHWRAYYNTSQNDLYNILIKKQQYLPNDILKLFTWKNNMKLSKKKLNTVNEVIVKNLSDINAIKVDTVVRSWNSNDDIVSPYVTRLFKDSGKENAVVWQAFLMHLMDPETFPIFDQHVWRGYEYIMRGSEQSFESTRLTMSSYLDEYRPWFNSKLITKHNDKSDISSKQFDEAMWAYGKYLTSPYVAILAN